MNSFGQKIKNTRIEKGFTQGDLADAAHLNLRTIQRIEKDVNAPTTKTLKLICKALEVDFDTYYEINHSAAHSRTLNIKLVFPYNWGQIRNVGIYADGGKLITKIRHCDNLKIQIDSNIKKVIIKLDIFRSEIEIPLNDDTLYLTVFMNFRDYFPFIYIDTLKRQCLTGRFVTAAEYEKFNLCFYQNSQKWILKSKIDKPNLILGLLISSALLIVSIIEQQNDYQDLLFFISAVSLISLIMIFNEKEKLLAFDYKSRMIATGLAFLLATLFLNSPFYVILVFLLFSAVFLLKSISEIKTE
jgi:transcriptional regulator with XRE-family HTH domain